MMTIELYLHFLQIQFTCAKNAEIWSLLMPEEEDGAVEGWKLWVREEPWW